MSNTDIKMSDVFPEGIKPNQLGIPLTCVHPIRRYGGDKFKYAAHAINSHDALIEQNKALKAALEQIKKHNETVTATPELSANWQIAARALERL